jgi:hypothetical protein
MLRQGRQTPRRTPAHDAPFGAPGQRAFLRVQTGDLAEMLPVQCGLQNLKELNKILVPFTFPGHYLIMKPLYPILSYKIKRKISGIPVVNVNAVSLSSINDYSQSQMLTL